MSSYYNSNLRIIESCPLICYLLMKSWARNCNMWLEWVCWDCLQVWSDWKWQCGGASSKRTRAWFGYVWGKWQIYIYAYLSFSLFGPLYWNQGTSTYLGVVLLQPDRVMEFCKNNDLQLIVRAHECVMDGFERFAQGHLITLFSATNYCGKYPICRLQYLNWM